MSFNESLAIDLLGAPEFIAGLWLARYYRRWAKGRISGLPYSALALAIYLATGWVGTSLRQAAFGTPSPAFISFGFGFAILMDNE